MEKQSKSRKIDFFRRLPDFISHRILSFLGFKDIARFSTLSTKCRELCLTLPVLTIELGNASGKELYKFNAFSHSFTSLNNEADVHQFKAEKYGQTLGGDHHIGNWILEATKSNVENIILRFNKFKIFSLPSGLSNSACLRDLEVRMNPQGLLNLPTTSFVGLEKLKLRDVRVSTNFDEWISSCKSLKMVHLHAVTCVNTLNLSSLSLEDLILKDMLVGSPNFNIKVSAERLRNLRIVWFYAPQPSQSLTLHAPKLEQFSWGGLVSHYSCEGNLESLSKSNISIDFNDERVALGIIGQVFQSIYRVSSISICDYSIKEISSPELLPEFSNLHSLTLKCTNSSIEIPSAISLLNLMPHLNSLKINGCHPSEKMEKSFSSEYWESQNLKFVHSLNEVDMHISGEHNEIELIKYLLKNAKSLKMLTIRFNTRILPCERSEISKKIRQFQVASSSSAIYFFIDH
nr:F-box/FBD/LRR-repeat protein At3g26920-like [Ziziphus jujuba var. spinosa]